MKISNREALMTERLNAQKLDVWLEVRIEFMPDFRNFAKILLTFPLNSEKKSHMLELNEVDAMVSVKWAH